MEATNTDLSLESLYNPNSLIVYKVVNNGQVSYTSIKTVDLEGKMRYLSNAVDQMNANYTKINSITSNLTADGWYSSDTTKEEILAELCELLDHSPVQSIVISATIDIEIEVDVAIQDVDSFDADDFVAENLSIDTWNGDAQVLNWDVRHTEVS